MFVRPSDIFQSHISDHTRVYKSRLKMSTMLRSVLLAHFDHLRVLFMHAKTDWVVDWVRCACLDCQFERLSRKHGIFNVWKRICEWHLCIVVKRKKTNLGICLPKSVREIINDEVETTTRRSQARFYYMCLMLGRVSQNKTHRELAWDFLISV